MGNIYKSAEGQAAIVAWYDKQLAQARLNTRIIQTTYGDTHIIEVGNAANPALILLPGTNFSAWSWRDYFASLSTYFHVIAVDPIGQPGKSGSNRLPFKGTGYGEWLVSVLNALQKDDVFVIGHSLGGWLALKLAAFARERVAKIVLVDPAGIVPLSINARVMVKSLPFMLMPGERSSRGLLELMSLHPPTIQNVEWMTLVSRHVNSSLAPPPVPSVELQNIKADILLHDNVTLQVCSPPTRFAIYRRLLEAAQRVSAWV